MTAQVWVTSIMMLPVTLTLQILSGQNPTVGVDKG